MRLTAEFVQVTGRAEGLAYSLLSRLSYGSSISGQVGWEVLPSIDLAAKLYDRERSRCCRDGWSEGNLGNAHGGVWIQRGDLEEVPHAVLERGANCPELVNYGAEQAGVSENAVGWL